VFKNNPTPQQPKQTQDKYNHSDKEELKERLTTLNSEIQKRSVEIEERDVYIQHLEQ